MLNKVTELNEWLDTIEGVISLDELNVRLASSGFDGAQINKIVSELHLKQTDREKIVREQLRIESSVQNLKEEIIGLHEADLIFKVNEELDRLAFSESINNEIIKRLNLNENTCNAIIGIRTVAQEINEQIYHSSNSESLFPVINEPLAKFDKKYDLNDTKLHSIVYRLKLPEDQRDAVIVEQTKIRTIAQKIKEQSYLSFDLDSLLHEINKQSAKYDYIDDTKLDVIIDRLKLPEDQRKAVIEEQAKIGTIAQKINKQIYHSSNSESLFPVINEPLAKFDKKYDLNDTKLRAIVNRLKLPEDQREAVIVEQTLIRSTAHEMNEQIRSFSDPKLLFPAINEQLTKYDINDTRLRAIIEQFAESNINDTQLRAIVEQFAKSDINDTPFRALNEHLEKYNLNDTQFDTISNHLEKPDIDDTQFRVLNERLENYFIYKGQLRPIVEQLAKSDINDTRLCAIIEQLVKSDDTHLRPIINQLAKPDLNDTRFHLIIDRLNLTEEEREAIRAQQIEIKATAREINEQIRSSSNQESLFKAINERLEKSDIKGFQHYLIIDRLDLNKEERETIRNQQLQIRTIVDEINEEIRSSSNQESLFKEINERLAEPDIKDFQVHAIIDRLDLNKEERETIRNQQLQIKTIVDEINEEIRSSLNQDDVSKEINERLAKPDINDIKLKGILARLKLSENHREIIKAEQTLIRNIADDLNKEIVSSSNPKSSVHKLNERLAKPDINDIKLKGILACLNLSENQREAIRVEQTLIRNIADDLNKEIVSSSNPKSSVHKLNKRLAKPDINDIKLEGILARLDLRGDQREAIRKKQIKIRSTKSRNLFARVIHSARSYLLKKVRGRNTVERTEGRRGLADADDVSKNNGREFQSLQQNQKVRQSLDSREKRDKPSPTLIP